jgi:phasin
MATTQSTPTPKPKPVPVAVPPAAPIAAAPAAPKFEMPKFDMPKFEVPKMEVPAAFREMAEKGLEQAKANYEKVKTAAEKATGSLEGAYTTASAGCSDYGLKLIETARTNSNAAFDLYGQLLGAKTYSEVVEKTTAYMRSQFEVMTAQAKVLAEQAKKVATDTAEPIKETMNSIKAA